MKLLKGDTVIVIAGGNSKRNNDKGKTGEVLSVNAKDNTVTVKGINVVVKHIKPNQQKQEGSIETFEAPIDASNVAYYDTKAKKIVKIGYKVIDGKKVRVDKKTGLELGKAAKKVAAKKEAKVEAPVEEVKEVVEEVKAVEKKPAAKKTTTKKTTEVKDAPAEKKTTKKSTKKAENEEK